MQLLSVPLQANSYGSSQPVKNLLYVGKCERGLLSPYMSMGNKPEAGQMQARWSSADQKQVKQF